jgi:Fe-S cluster assembly protein SufD
MSGFPTRKDEAWRYSDLKALEAVWPLRTRDEPAMPMDLSNGACHQLSTSDGWQSIEIIIADGTEATLVQDIVGINALYTRIDIKLGVDAKLTHIIKQTSNASCVSLAEMSAHMQAGAQYQAFALNMGSAFGRFTFDAFMHGVGASFQIDAVQLARATQTLEIITRTHHHVGHCISNQRIRTVAAEKATASYLGSIFVDHGAQKTDAAQSSKALLLHRTATVNTKPELQIYADDVKCAHGATVGELDKKALFYCQTRGIPLEQARAMLTEAFVADAVEQIADDRLRAEVETLCASWLQQAVRHA